LKPSEPVILVVYSVVDALDHGEPEDILAEQEPAQVAQDAVVALQNLGMSAVPVPVRDNVPAAMQGYSPDDAVVLNLCEGLANQASGEWIAARGLEELGFLFTGSSSDVLRDCMDKSLTHERLAAAGVDTPAYQVMETGREPLTVPLPAIVKPVAQDGSLGIPIDAVAATDARVRQRVESLRAAYHQAALVEEFVGGREFNVAVWGNEHPSTLPLGELIFVDMPDPLQRIASFEAKWRTDLPQYHSTPVRVPAEVDEATAAAIRDVALRAYAASGCRDYARIDLRLGERGPLVLEVNPNPDLARDAGFVRVAGAAGHTFATMLHQIIQFAQKRGRS
jgi:D-alanine-D-alanine ligase